MLDFIFIITIFFEIILTVICVIKIIDYDKKCKELNEKLILNSEIIKEINEKIKTTITKINKFVSFVTNKKLIKIGQILRTTVDVIQIIILIRSFNLTKGAKSINFKNIKKLLLVETSRRIIRKLIQTM